MSYDELDPYGSSEQTLKAVGRFKSRAAADWHRTVCLISNAVARDSARGKFKQKRNGPARRSKVSLAPVSIQQVENDE